MITEGDRKAAQVMGISPEEWVRRSSPTSREARQQFRVPGGVAVFADRRLANGGDDDADTSKTPAEIATEAQQHLQKFFNAPDADDAPDHLARAGAMIAAATARCSRARRSW